MKIINTAELTEAAFEAGRAYQRSIERFARELRMQEGGQALLPDEEKALKKLELLRSYCRQRTQEHENDGKWWWE
jgi:hypothetical protein